MHILHLKVVYILSRSYSALRDGSLRIKVPPVDIDAVSRTTDESQNGLTSSRATSRLKSTYESTANDNMRDTCTRNVDCIMDSIQSKIEDLLKNLYPELPLGDRRW